MAIFATDRTEHLDNQTRHVQVGGVDSHQSIYKYVGLSNKRSWNYFEQMLESGELIGSTAASLNDPFEARPRIIDNLNQNVFEEICKYFNKSGELRDARDHLGIDEAEKFSERTKKALDKFIENARILSFCMRSDSPLLWSHYANSHKGACIHFSFSAFSEVESTKGAVAYQRSRPVIPLSLPGRIVAAGSDRQHPEDRARLRRELFKQCFFVKPLDWSYEEEARIIYMANKATNLPFDKSGLFEIVLGARCELETQKRISDLVDRHCPNVKIRRAKIDEDTFSVGIE